MRENNVLSRSYNWPDICIATVLSELGSPTGPRVGPHCLETDEVDLKHSPVPGPSVASMRRVGVLTSMELLFSGVLIS